MRSLSFLQMLSINSLPVRYVFAISSISPLTSFTTIRALPLPLHDRSRAILSLRDSASTNSYSRGSGWRRIQWQGSLRGARGPASGFADRRKRKAVQRRRAVPPQRFEMVGGAVTLVSRQPILRIELVQLFEPRIARHFGDDGSGCNRDRARVAFDQRALLDQHVEMHGVNQQKVGRDAKLQECGLHGLQAGLADVPGVYARGVHFGDGPGKGVLANAFGKNGTARGRKFFGVVKADNAPPGIENDRGCEDRAEQGAAADFVETRDARPAALPRFALIACATEPPHWPGVLAPCAAGFPGRSGKGCAFRRVLDSPSPAVAHSLRIQEMEMAATGSDPARELLRHTVSTLAYRGGKALRGAPEGFAEFKAGPTSRPAGRILAPPCRFWCS